MAPAPTSHSEPPPQTPQTSYSAIGGLQDALRSSAVRSTSPSTSSSPYDGQLKVCFLEKQSEFVWHGGMLLPGSKMQISFLKDLVTMRNPTSPYSFLSYLHQSSSPSRLVSFISRGTFTPSRVEYADYMRWAALKIAGELEGGEAPGARGGVCYGEEVLSVSAIAGAPSHGDRTTLSHAQSAQDESTLSQEDVQLLLVTSRTSSGEIVTRRTRNLCIGTGGGPRLPTSLRALSIAPSNNSSSSPSQAQTRVIHTSQFLNKVPPALDSILAQAKSTPQDRPIRIAVLGAGQSAAETFLAVREMLASRLAALPPSQLAPLARAQVELLIKKGSLHAAEDAAFGNEVFDPGMSQAVYGLDSEARKRVMREAKGTNYAVVNPTTLEGMYEIMYEQRVAEELQGASKEEVEGDPKLSIKAFTSLVGARLAEEEEGREGALVLELENVLNGEKREETYDLVICGTGYDRSGWRKILFPSTTTTTSDAGTTTTSADVGATSLAELFESRPESPGLTRQDADPLLQHATDKLAATHLTEPEAESSAGRRPREVSAARSNSTLAPSSASSAIDESYPSSRSSAPSTPLTSLSTSSSRSRPQKKEEDSLDFGVSVNYKLRLPERTRDGRRRRFKPTVWLQGANEDSHGISDSLLSVLAVRSGEVARGVRGEGWFGE